MSNVVLAALKYEGDSHTWTVRFSDDQTLTGQIAPLFGDMYRLSYDDTEYYFDANKVIYMYKRE